VIIKLAKRNGGIYEPEMRLSLFFLPGILMPVGVMMYGLTTAEVGDENPRLLSESTPD
jgi:hypothetical protein